MMTGAQVLDAMPIAIYLTDLDGMLTYFNPAAVRFWGQEPTLGVARWCGSHRLFLLDGTPVAHEDCPMAVAVRERRPIRGITAIAERPDGERVRFQPFPTPVRNEAGEVIGMLNVLIRENAVPDMDPPAENAALADFNARMTEALGIIQYLSASALENLPQRPGTVAPEDRPPAQIIPLPRKPD
ncbi:hypothetical protein sos41_31850 [Alphaproteobacteria bacterium SO-S41]|nr:hypothetical protein sos41_31850 [Alphaproteobacteria bacterium SO-S41]